MSDLEPYDRMRDAEMHRGARLSAVTLYEYVGETRHESGAESGVNQQQNAGNRRGERPMTIIEFKAAVKTDHRKIWFHASAPCRCLSLAEVREHARAILTDDGPDCVLYETDDARHIHVTRAMVS